jgi:D-alanyl-D-alanine carboxypeptidase
MNDQGSSNADAPRAPTDTSTGAVRAAIAAGFALGVPRDYARKRHLRLMREPAHLVFIGYGTQHKPQWLAPQAARAWQRMHDVAANVGIELLVVSAFRSVAYQLGIVRRKLDSGQSMDQILRVSAAPGYSEHHSGRALDITTPGFAALEEEFEHSPAFGWLSTNAKRYGFSLSFDRDNPHGIGYEPWHWCWHGKTKSR